VGGASTGFMVGVGKDAGSSTNTFKSGMRGTVGVRMTVGGVAGEGMLNGVVTSG
jgi:hypothetical protein